MDIIKTSIDLLSVDGVQVDFNQLTQDFRLQAALINTLPAQISGLQNKLVAAQNDSASTVAIVTAIYAQYPADVPADVIQIFNLNTSGS
jgi:hypothetical protein